MSVVRWLPIEECDPLADIRRAVEWNKVIPDYLLVPDSERYCIGHELVTKSQFDAEWNNQHPPQ